MDTINHLPGIKTKEIDTSRIKTFFLSCGADEGELVLFVHGNCSTAAFWEETMLSLTSTFPKYRAIAPDLRGYGKTEEKPVDATKGPGDWVEDLTALLDALHIQKYHVIGHSLGGMIVYGLMEAHKSRILSATLVCPASPYGFGGTSGIEGKLNNEDGSGSGGGCANPQFAKLLAEKSRGSDLPISPRNVLNSFYFKPPFKSAREEDLLSSILQTKIGEQYYPGDSQKSTQWPFIAPGKYGPLNSMGANYLNKFPVRLIESAKEGKIRVLWVRGSNDQICSDFSLFDLAVLGKLGAVPGYPGESVIPPQPMIAQTRDVLTKYQANGGSFDEFVIEETGHTPYIEKPDVFNKKFFDFLNGK